MTFLNKVFRQVFADLVNPTEPTQDLASRKQHIDNLLVVSNRSKTAPSPPGFNVPTQVEDASIPETSGSPRLAVAKAKKEMLSCVPTKDIAVANKVSDERIIRHREHLIGGSGPKGERNSTVIRRTEGTLCVGTTILIRLCISGPPSLQASIRKLLTKYAAIFSDKLSKECALVAPMELKVDETECCTQTNRRPNWPVSSVKQKEIRKQSDEMLDS